MFTPQIGGFHSLQLDGVATPFFKWENGLVWEFNHQKTASLYLTCFFWGVKPSARQNPLQVGGSIIKNYEGDTAKLETFIDARWHRELQVGPGMLSKDEEMKDEEIDQM